MAPSLPDLPAELLLLIVELSDSLQKPPYSTQRLTMERLRAVHPQLNEKLVLSYGVKYFKQLWVTIDQARLSHFSDAVAGHLGMHVNSLMFDTSNLIQQNYRSELSDSTDAGLNSWHTSKDKETFDEPMNVYYDFNDDVIEVIVDGTYATCLAETLVKLPNLASIAIYPPTAPDGLDFWKARDIKHRWTMVLKVTLSAIIAKCPPLKKLEIRTTHRMIATPFTDLDLYGISASRLVVLKVLHLELNFNVSKVLESLHAQVFARFLNNAAALDDLRIAFYDSTDTFFKALATSMSPKHLTKLHITHVTARYKYWAIFVGMFKDSLRSLEMGIITFTKTDEEYHVFDFLCRVLRLERCILRKVSVAGRVLDFTIAHDQMPDTERRVRKKHGKRPADGEMITVRIRKGARNELLLCEQDDEYCHEVRNWLSIILELAIEKCL